MVVLIILSLEYCLTDKFPSIVKSFATYKLLFNDTSPLIITLPFADKSASAMTLLWKVETPATPNVLLNVAASVTDNVLAMVVAPVTSNVLFIVDPPSTRRVSRKTVAPPIEAVVLADRSASAMTLLWKVETPATPNVLLNVAASVTDNVLAMVVAPVTSNVLFIVDPPSTRRVSRKTVAPPIEAVVLADRSASAMTLLWNVEIPATPNVLAMVVAPFTDNPKFIETSPVDLITIRSTASPDTVLPASAV